MIIFRLLAGRLTVLLVKSNINLLESAAAGLLQVPQPGESSGPRTRDVTQRIPHPFAHCADNKEEAYQAKDGKWRNSLEHCGLWE